MKKLFKILSKEIVSKEDAIQRYRIQKAIYNTLNKLVPVIILQVIFLAFLEQNPANYSTYMVIIVVVSLTWWHECRYKIPRSLKALAAEITARGGAVPEDSKGSKWPSIFVILGLLFTLLFIIGAVIKMMALKH